MTGQTGPRPGQIKYLGEHANTDSSVRDAVRGYIRQLGAPFILKEVWKPLGLPRHVVNRELRRMVRAGLLERHKIPRRWNGLRNDGTIIPDEVIRQVFLYTPTEAFA